MLQINIGWCMTYMVYNILENYYTVTTEYFDCPQNGFPPLTSFLRCLGNAASLWVLHNKHANQLRDVFFSSLSECQAVEYILHKHLKAKLLQSYTSEADDLSLRSPKSWSPYLVLFPLSRRQLYGRLLQSSMLLSPLHCVHTPRAQRIEPQFIQLHVSGFIKNVICNVSMCSKGTWYLFLLYIQHCKAQGTPEDACMHGSI